MIGVFKPPSEIDRKAALGVLAGTSSSYKWAFIDSEEFWVSIPTPSKLV